MKRRLIIGAILLSVALAFPAYSGEWFGSDDIGWIYRDDNGDMVKNSWVQGADTKWYYLDSTGHMLRDTTTPDGYYVGHDGAWVTDNSAASSSTTQISRSFEELVQIIKDSFLGPAKPVGDDRLMQFKHVSGDKDVNTIYITEDIYFTGDVSESEKKTIAASLLRNSETIDSYTELARLMSKQYDGGDIRLCVTITYNNSFVDCEFYK